MKFKIAICVLFSVNTFISFAQEKTKYIEDEVYFYVESEYVKKYPNSDRIYLTGKLG